MTTYKKTKTLNPNSKNDKKLAEMRLYCLNEITGDSGGAVDEYKDHATEGPCDTEDSDAITRFGLFVVADDGGDCDVEKEESGNELSDKGSVEGPEGEFGDVDEWSRGWVDVVLSEAGLSLFRDFFRHCV